MCIEQKGGAEFDIGGVVTGIIGVVDAGGGIVDFFGVPIESVVGNGGCRGGSWRLAVVVHAAAFIFAAKKNKVSYGMMGVIIGIVIAVDTDEVGVIAFGFDGPPVFQFGDGRCSFC